MPITPSLNQPCLKGFKASKHRLGKWTLSYGIKEKGISKSPLVYLKWHLSLRWKECDSFARMRSDKNLAHD